MARLADSYPAAWDKGFHWTKPVYDGQWQGHCGFLDEGVCYYDGSGLNADPLLVTLVYDGEEAVWEELEQYYIEVKAKADQLR